MRMPFLRIPVLAAVLTLLAVALPPPAASRGRAYSAADLALIAERVLAGVNEARAAAGVAPLSRDDRVAAVATAHANDMANRRYFGHVTPEGRTHGARARSAGIAFARYGENILKVDNPAEPPERLAATIVRGFLGSAKHRAGLLLKDFSLTGVAVARVGRGPLLVVQNFLMPAGGTPSGAVVAAPAEDRKARRRAAGEAALRRLLERRGQLRSTDLEGPLRDLLRTR